MKKKMIRMLMMISGIAIVLSGCAGSTGAGKDSNSADEKAVETKSDDTEKEDKASDHEVITINAPYHNISSFIDLVHEKYPEINMEVEPYSGTNTTAWMREMMNSGNLPDIYFTTSYSAVNEDVGDKLLDLSGYDFTDRYVQSRLREVTSDGAIYMLPLHYSCFGITYNKTLLDKNGWELPTSLEELEELAPKVEAAGYNLCLDMYQYPGYGFQYLCDILDTGFLSTLDGLRWQEDFIEGKATVKDTPGMMEDLKILERWKKTGMLNDKGDPVSDDATKEEMLKGNTLFLIGSSNDLYTDDKEHDEFRLMPYLSEDGRQNVFILNVNRYVGLNKDLTDKGNEQKLEDALHIMEVLSTEEGMWALSSSQKDTALLPLKDAKISENSYYADVLDEINAGHTAPFIYSGWENVVVPVGNKMIEYARGEADLDEVIACFDDNQSLLMDSSEAAYTTATEILNTDDCAKLVGICFAKATGSDAALVSENIYQPEDEDMDQEGVSGALYPLPVTEQEIVAILPTGWNGNIQTVTLTGARIKELAEKGYDRNDTGILYPYAFVTMEGTELEDDVTYKVAICGAAPEIQEEGNIQDSGIVGLDAAKEYFAQFETLSRKDIVWE